MTILKLIICPVNKWLKGPSEAALDVSPIMPRGIPKRGKIQALSQARPKLQLLNSAPSLSVKLLRGKLMQSMVDKDFDFAFWVSISGQRQVSPSLPQHATHAYINVTLKICWCCGKQ